MKKLLLLFALLCAAAFGQVHSDIATQNTQGNWVKAIPEALVYLCDIATTDLACLVGTGTVQLYTDKTLSITTTQPVTADSNGNYTLYANPGIYKQCVKGVTTFCQIIEVPSVNTTVIPSVTCPGALPGSLAAWTTPTDLSCDPHSITDFLGNLQSQSYQAVGPHNGEVWLTTDGVVSTSALPAGTIGLVVPNVVATPFRVNVPPAPCTDGQVWQQLSHSTDASGTYNAFLNCLTLGFGTGSVTSFSAGTLSPIFTTSVANSTTTPALSFILTNAAAHTFLGNTSGSSAAPSYSALPALPLSCQTGLGDGLNAMAAGTYLQSFCRNDSGQTWTLTGIRCLTDNNGTSTMNVSNGSGTGLLTGAVTCTNAWAAGTQSATVTIANGDYAKFTFVADGTSKQTAWEIQFTQPQ